MVAQVAEISVGAAQDIKVHRIVTAIDVGRVIDRSGLEAQVEGGVGWALSAALKTQITFENRRARQSNFHDFPVLRMREMPRQDIEIVESAWGPSAPVSRRSPPWRLPLRTPSSRQRADAFVKRLFGSTRRHPEDDASIDYSYRNACIGSTRDARSAGR